MSDSVYSLEVAYHGKGVGRFFPDKVTGRVKAAFPEATIDPTDYQERRLELRVERLGQARDDRRNPRVDDPTIEVVEPPLRAELSIRDPDHNWRVDPGAGAKLLHQRHGAFQRWSGNATTGYRVPEIPSVRSTSIDGSRIACPRINGQDGSTVTTPPNSNARSLAHEIMSPSL